MSISEISPIGACQVSVAPAGLTIVSGLTYDNTSGTFAAANSGAQLIFNSKNIDMMIPSGMNPNIFCDTRDTTFLGK